MTFALDRLSLKAATFMFALTATSALASAAITINKAEISGGKLVVTGNRTGTATILSLDTDFSTGVTGAGNFAFNLTYIPPDCIATITGTNGSAGTVDAVIANCGPQGLNAKGAWSDAANYGEDDVVTAGGSSYRAKRANLNKAPASSAADWEVLAARGARGIQGASGQAGAIGPEGATGPAGPQGSQGVAGPAGDTGAAGTNGATGATGETGATGPQGPQGVVSVLSTSGNGNNPSATLNFIGPTLSVTIAAGQKIHMVASKALGSTLAGGGTGLNLYPCFRPNGGSIEPLGGGMFGLQVPQNTLEVFTMNFAFMFLGAGTYDIGMCGYSATNASSWNNNEWGYITVMVLN